MATITDQRGTVAGLNAFWRRAEPDIGASPVLFVHGVPVNSDDWLPFLERVGGFAPDLPGFGRSDKPSTFDYSIPGYDKWLEAFLDENGIDRFSMVVHDWGGLGLATAQRLHARLDRLVMFTCLPMLPGFSWHRVARIWRTPVLGELFQGLSTKWALRQFSKEANVTPGPLPQQMLDGIWEHYDHGTQRAILKLYRFGSPEVLEASGRDLGRIDCPALVLWPDQDPYSDPKFGPSYAEAIGDNAELRMVENAGHWMWLDRPDLIDDVAVFLAG